MSRKWFSCVTTAGKWMAWDRRTPVLYGRTRVKQALLVVLITLAGTQVCLSNENGQIYILRKTGLKGTVWRTPTFIDHKFVCKAKNNRFSVYEVKPGAHIVSMQLTGKEEKTKKMINPPISVLVEPGKSYFILLYQKGTVFSDVLGSELANVLQLLGSVPGGEWTYHGVPLEVGNKLLGTLKEDDECSVTSFQRGQPKVGGEQAEQSTSSSNATISSIDRSQDQPVPGEVPNPVSENLSPFIGNWKGHFGSGGWISSITLQLTEQDGEILRGYGSISGGSISCYQSPVTLTPGSSGKYLITINGGGCRGELEVEAHGATLTGRITFPTQTQFVRVSLAKVN